MMRPMTGLESIADALRRRVARLRFGPPAAYVYNPLEYAWPAHAAYLRKYGRGRREVLLLGMNPGPFGMAQTGVPFGEVGRVRDWLGIVAAVGHPRWEHPRRPIEGFACRRREVSGARLWGWAEARYGTPRRFFERFFVANYCPLCFMDAAGRNMTPDRLSAVNRAALLTACDAALWETMAQLRPRVVVGVGAFAEARVRAVMADRIRDAAWARTIQVMRVLHPSPASPLANRGWEAHMDALVGRIDAVVR